MSRIRGWVDFTRVVSGGGLALFAVVTLTVPHETRVGGFFNLWVYNALMVFACVVVASRALVSRHRRGAWIAITLAVASWTFGELWYAVVRPETFPSTADCGFLGFYPLLFVGIALLLRSQGAIGGTLWLDGLTAALGAAALGAAVLVELVLRTTEGSLSTVATNLAYPLGDVLLLAAVFGAFSLARWRPGRMWLLLGLGMLATAIADSVYLFQSAAGTYQDGTWIDVLWPAALLSIACAAWAGDQTERELDVAGRPLLAVPAVCALGATALLVGENFRSMNALAVALAAATLVTVVLRLALTFRENGRLFEQTRTDAVTDPLTTLGNRRKLVADLERRLRLVSADEPWLLMIFDLDGFKGYNDTFGHLAGDALLARLGLKLAAVPGDAGAAYRLGGDEFCLLAPARDAEAEGLIDRSVKALEEHGDGFSVTASFGAAVLPEEAAEGSDALRLADERLYAQKYAKRARREDPHEGLLETLYEFEPTLRTHLQDVAALAHEVGRMLGLDGPELEELEHAARLHDLGKVAIPETILNKPGPLDASEMTFMRQHTIVGERILRATPSMRGVAGIVRATHERWDGAGYPDGLAGEDIPLAARIIFICDAFDAMTLERAYGVTFSVPEALAELERCSGTQFDPAIVRIVTSIVRAHGAAAHAA
jgi:diguanylate cyclase (GGDEF)-like protein